MHTTCRTSPSSLVSSSYQHLVHSTNYEDPHYLFPPSTFYFSLGSKYSLQHPVLRHSRLYSSPNVRDEV
jgi:hypothetical protein